MPPINRPQVTALLRAGAIDERTANVYLSRLEAGQTVDVPARLVTQADEALRPSPAGRLAQTIRPALKTVARAEFERTGIPGIVQALRAAFTPPVPTGSLTAPTGTGSLPGLFDRPAPVEGEPTPPPPVAPTDDAATAIAAALEQGGGATGTEITGQLTPLVANGQPVPGMFLNEFGQVVQVPTAEERTAGIAQRMQQQAAFESPSEIRAREAQALARQEASQGRIAERQQADAIKLQELRGRQALEQSAAAALLQLMTQPGGEFLARATQERRTGQTPVFNPATDLRQLAPEQFAEMFGGARQPGFGLPERGEAVTGTSNIIRALQEQQSLGQGGIAATGQAGFGTIPNIRQITGLSDAELAELNAILPQLTGQSVQDLSRQARPPAAGRAAAMFR